MASAQAARVSPRWEDARTVGSFAAGAPNANLLAFARRVLAAKPDARCLDVGCGAARNALPLAELGFRVAATDLSTPMLDAARARIAASPHGVGVELVRAPMAPLPFEDGAFDLVVAHGIWNLARSGTEFRAAAAEAARVARPGAGLFLFTFSRRTLPADARPDAGETFVFSSWAGEPQCFLTETEIVAELAAAGFVRDGDGPLTEYNAPRPGEIRVGGPPVIFEGTFVRRRNVDIPVYVEFEPADGPAFSVYARQSFVLNTTRAAAPSPRGATTSTEIYFRVDDPAAAAARAVAAGAEMLSPCAPRPWGDEVAYVADLDGNVLAFGREL